MHLVGDAVKVERGVADVILSDLLELEGHAVDGLVGHLFGVMATPADEDADEPSANGFVLIPGLFAVLAEPLKQPIEIFLRQGMRFAHRVNSDPKRCES